MEAERALEEYKNSQKLVLIDELEARKRLLQHFAFISEDDAIIDKACINFEYFFRNFNWQFLHTSCTFRVGWRVNCTQEMNFY